MATDRPTSWTIVPEAWSVFVNYATFRMPSEPNGYYQYNALQQLAYFGITFIIAPLAKMVKWISAIEVAVDAKHVHKGFGKYTEDNEFFDTMADI